MKQPIVLDSFALISFFHQEPGWESVRTVFKDLTAAGERAALSGSTGANSITSFKGGSAGKNPGGRGPH